MSQITRMPRIKKAIGENDVTGRREVSRPVVETRVHRIRGYLVVSIAIPGRNPGHLKSEI